MREPPDITLRLLESAASDPEAELLLEARDEIERLRKHIREQAAELERIRKMGARYAVAMMLIRELTEKRQLPITSQINDIATEAIDKSRTIH